LPGYVRAVLLIAVMWFYIAFIHWPVSATRAVFFWTLALVGFELRQLVSLATVIILTVAMMVTFNPLVLQDIGFQLSVGAVIGIAIATLVSRRLPRAVHEYGIFELALASLGATVATWPIIAYHFGT